MQRLIAKSIVGFIFLVSVFPAHAQTRTTRLYLPISTNTEMLIEDGQEKVLVKDYLNSTRVVLSATTIEEQAYYPFGEGAKNTTLTATDKEFTGHRLVHDSVYQAQARFYNADLGIFTQPDSIEGPNRFAYVDGNPILLNDLNGQQGGDSTRRAIRQIVQEVIVGAFSIAKDPSIEHSNQDALFCFKCANGGSAIGVFDGMGGHAGGRQASQTARTTIGQAIQNSDARNANEGLRVLSDAFHRANQEVGARAYADPRLRGMGTTATVAWVLPNGEIALGSIGDSRAYGMNAQGKLAHLTLDDSFGTKYLTNAQAEALQWKLANVTNSSQLGSDTERWFNRNVIGQAIMGDPINPAFSTVSPNWGIKRLAITSDGVHDAVTNIPIGRALSKAPDPRSAAQEMVMAARNATGFRAKRDDVSAAVIFFR